MSRSHDALPALGRARAALEIGAGATALRALIDAWRVCRTPELAELVERLSVRVAQGRSLPPAKTQKQALLDWIERARRRDPADLHLLIEAFERIFERGYKQQIIACLDELAERRDDPRLSMRVATWRHGNFRIFGHQHKLSQRYDRLLLACGDPRLLPDGRFRSAAFQAEIAARLVELGSSIEPETEPNAELDELAASEREQLLKLIASAKLDPAADPKPRASGPKTREQLFEAVYADPGDDAARMVLGDWLLSQGDPHGELIRLQLHRPDHEPSREIRSRERALLAEHATTWLGPLARLAVKRGLMFERGFPVAVALKPIAARLVEAEQDHREWATLERVIFARRSRGSAAIISPHMRAVRELENVCDAGLLALATRHDTLPVEHLSYHTVNRWGWTGKGIKALGECEGLTRLRSFWMLHDLMPQDAAWLWDSKLGERLRAFHMESRQSLADWRQVPIHVQRIVLHRGESWWMLERDDRGRWARVHVHLAERDGEVIATTPLAGLANDLDEVRVEVDTRHARLAARVEQLTRQLAHFDHARLDIGEWTRERPVWLPEARPAIKAR
ncbi:TIGR02996 domain-containing protein [Enhygromyxa salina]|uniref:Uncharacterized protein n=1 Tax=Enhygromyxa salina TaxID=215803 RepID=A0A2S9YPK4_9BACT|nr:TIGR02996 domain-containing protein [Enhygromyxa salina]PRQ07024.1 hypothetical protein ENSA7_32480 [Enhygromyxa salina]